MMIVLSIAHLLDGIRRFLSIPRLKEYEFIGVDSSFGIRFKKHEKGGVGIYIDNQIIHVVNTSRLKSELVRAVLDFVNTHDLSQMATEAELGDFEDAVRQFCEFSTD